MTYASVIIALRLIVNDYDTGQVFTTTTTTTTTTLCPKK